MTPNSRWIYAVSFALGATGFLLPLWPLSVLGVLLCALSGRFIFALFMGLLLDLAWGAPTGTARFLFFPFFAVALVAALGRYFGGRFLFDRRPQERL
jgi:hypothetical protein